MLEIGRVEIELIERKNDLASRDLRVRDLNEYNLFCFDILSLCRLNISDGVFETFISSIEKNLNLQ